MLNRVAPALCCCLLAGCGYSTRALIPSHLKTIAISEVRNSTTQPALGDELLDSLSVVLARDRTLRLTTTDDADLHVAANVNAYSRDAVAYDAGQTISGYEVRVSAAVEAEDRVRGEVYYSGPHTARMTYDPANKTEEQATSLAIGLLARDIVRAILTAW